MSLKPHEQKVLDLDWSVAILDTKGKRLIL
jgi:hypothetical protein